MSLEQIIFGVPAILCSDYGEEVILGPVSSEGKTITAKITSHAVEEGAEVTDHVDVLPPHFTVNTILADEVSLLDRAGEALKEAVGLTGDTRNVKEKLQLLEAWQEMGQLLTYSGPVFSNALMDGYDMIAENLVIEKLTLKRSKGTGSGMEFAISLKRVTIVQSRIEEIKLPQKVRRRKRKGKSTTKKQKARIRSSILKGIKG